MKNIWKALKNNKGFSLVEILVTIFIIAFVMASLMGVFVQAATTQSTSESLTRAEAVAQQFTESLYNMTYESVLAKKAEKFAYKGYYLTFALEPSGGDKAGLNNASYVHIIYTGSKCIVVGADGKSAVCATVPNNIAITATGTGYAVNYESGSISGTKSLGTLIVLINTMNKSTSSNKNVSLGADTTGFYYCTSTNAAEVAVTGSCTTYKQLFHADKSLIRAKVSAYKKSTDENPIAVIENMLQISNS